MGTRIAVSALVLVSLAPSLAWGSFTCTWRSITGLPDPQICAGRTTCDVGTVNSTIAKLSASVGIESQYPLRSRYFDYTKALNDTRWRWATFAVSPIHRVYNLLNPPSPDVLETLEIYPGQLPTGPSVVQPRLEWSESSDPTFFLPTGCQSLALQISVQPPPTPVSVSLGISAPIVVEGSATTLSWTSTGATTCTASGGLPGDGWSGPKPTSGVQSVTPGRTVGYAIGCTGPAGTKTASTTAHVFGTPQNLGAVVNRSGDEISVSINRAAPNTAILFGYVPPGGTGDIHHALYTPSIDRWSPPAPLPAPVNSSAHEHAATNQGTQLVLGGWRVAPATNVDLFQAIWNGSGFSFPTTLTGVSTPSNEAYPFVTSDGAKLLFASDRPGGAGSYDIYQAVPTASGWGSVTRLGSPISSSAADISPFTVFDGSALFFCSNRGGNFDVYYALKQGSGWGTPIAFAAPLNTSSAEQSPALTDDGTRLYFVSNRPGGYGGLDLYVAIRK